jgi:hypothetical protein
MANYNSKPTNNFLGNDENNSHSHITEQDA